MKRTTLIALLLAAGGISASQTLAEVTYREVFGNASGPKSLAYAGWIGQVWDEDTNFLYTMGENFLLDGSQDGGGVAPVNSFPAEPLELTNGQIENFFGGDFWIGSQLYFTEEYTLDRSANTLDSVSFFTNANGGTVVRGAVRIGSQWYVQSTTQSGFGVINVDVATTVWAPMSSLDLSVGSPLGSPGLPVGTATAFGTWVDTAGYIVIDRFTASASASPSWTSAASGDWNEPSNWAGAVPNAVGAVARFEAVNPASRTVYTDVPVTVGALAINSPNTFVITGSGSLALDVSAGSASLDVLAGSHRIALPLNINDLANISIASGATLTLSGGTVLAAGITVNKNGAGTLTVLSPLSAAGPATLKINGGTVNLDAVTVQPGLTVNVDPATLNVGANQTFGSLVLDLGDNIVRVGRNSAGLDLAANLTAASLSVTNGGGNIVQTTLPGNLLTVTGALSIDPVSALEKAGPGTLSAASIAGNGDLAVSGGSVSVRRGGVTSVLSTLTVSAGTLDLTNNDLVLTGTSLAAVNTLLGTGGLSSSSAGSPSTGDPRDVFAGLAAIGNDPGFGFPLFATFEGVGVSLTDVLVKYTYVGDTNLDGTLDASDFNAVLNGLTNGLGGWANGDSNYDGVVDAADWTRFLSAYSYVLGGGLPFGNESTPGQIPEPAGIAVLALAGGLLSRRRR
jgi:hypothetical protein